MDRRAGPERTVAVAAWPEKPYKSGMAHKTVFLTGASSGLGYGLALHYARAGATVYGVARRAERLERLAAEARGRGGGRVIPVALDVTDGEALAAAVRAAEEAAGGSLDLVVANAGLGDPTPADRIDWRLVKRILDVNASAACVTLASSLPAMVARGSGTVVAISSLAAFRGLPSSAAYCASKAALDVFMESLRVDLRGTGVRALTIHPGFVNTERAAHDRFPRPFAMDTAEAVRVMARAIDRGAAVTAFPFPLAALARMARVLPRALYEPLARGRRTG